jgi:type VI secretion system secreted protein VgrG
MSLVADIVAALSGGFTQDTRLLRLHTPLGANALLAERAQVHEAIFPGTHTEAANGFAMSVEALSPDTHLELKALMGQPVLLELLPADSRVELRPWHGHVTQAELLGSDGGLARYRLTVEPWLAFLGHRQDSYVFQGQTVVQIIDEVFGDYQAQGQLAPAWRWELSDASVYPQRSLCIQYQETDLQFVQRLLREEGLIAWWEHSGAPGDASLGQHTLVIADHNGAFAPNRQAKVRYTQSGAALQEDSLTQFKRASQLHTASLNLASADYRSLSLRQISQSASQTTSAPLTELQLSDIPGAYAYEDNAQGERLALRQMQALDALRQRTNATGTLRRAAPGTHWLLTEHPVHTGLDTEHDQFVTLAVSHAARNNLSADLKAKLHSLALSIAHAKTDAPRQLANESEEPLYQCQISAQPLATPVRPVTLDAQGLPDPRLHTRPSITGVQTAIVVGDEPVHSDRDHRIKIQFHWQRGGGSSLRLNHPSSTSADNAPASDASGTWVRVAERVAGANWGANFTPRVGQEVLVSFLNGDIDRPVVVGSVYNGKGQSDAQGNQVSAGAANATGNANPWFPGTQAQGPLQAHQHTQVHTGFKTQELSSSQSGSGGYNQLVFDDSPAGQNRVELSSSTQATRLQLGHLLHQNDNQRLNPRGHGIDISTAAWGAVRAGSGVLISAHAKPASTAGGQQLDSREPLSRLEQGQSLIHALAETAQAHNAKLTAPTKEADVKGATQKDKAKHLQVEQGLWATQDSLKATTSNGDDAGDESAINGGHGTATAWGRPDMVLAAPGGIASFTPASHIASAGATTSLAAGQDVHHLAQANHASAAKDGLILFSYGKASNPNKPNQETGIALHAASGGVSTQSQSAATKITADKNVDFASTTAMVKIAAPKHVLLTAAGAAITIQSGSITLKGPGKVEFKAGQKVFAAGASATSASPAMAKVAELKGCAKTMSDAASQQSSTAMLG